jgi:ketosteroid isomerase-like protein
MVVLQWPFSWRMALFLNTLKCVEGSGDLFRQSELSPTAGIGQAQRHNAITRLHQDNHRGFGGVMDQQQVQAIAERFIAELHRIEEGDAAGVDRMVDMFADDAELTNPLIERDDSSRNGRDQIAEFWREYRTTFKNIRSEFFDRTASDHSAGLFWRSKGTNATGQPLEYEGVSLLTLDENGKIARFNGYFDSRQITMPARS